MFYYKLVKIPAWRRKKIRSLGLANANYIGWINDIVLQYSSGKYVHYLVIKHNGNIYMQELTTL